MSDAGRLSAIPGRRPVAEALASGRAIERLLVERDTGGLDALVESAETAGVPVDRVTGDRLAVAAGGTLHQGVVALAAPPRHLRLRDLAEADLVVVCDGITDPHNLGAIARSAEAAGATGLVLARRRRSPISPAAEKAAAGAFSWLAVVEAAPAQALAEFADAGRWSVGLHGDAALSLWDCPVLVDPLALVVGDEGRGLARLTRERCDVVVRIPTVGHVGSLNASVAAGVALMEARRRRDWA